jgi:hypothetical protein
MSWNSLFAIPLMVSAAIFATAAVTRATEDKSKTKTVQATIEKGIKLLEAKEYASFLKQFVKPEDMDRILKEAKSLDKFAEKFGQDSAADLLKVFKHIKDAPPLLSSDGKQAKYMLNVPGIHQKEITFTKVDNRWCVEDH